MTDTHYEFVEKTTVITSNKLSDGDPMAIAKYKCNCQYLWLRELHGLTALMMTNSLSTKIFWLLVIIVCASTSIAFTATILDNYNHQQTSTLITVTPVNRLEYPTFVYCPKNADALNYSLLLEDIFTSVANITMEISLDLIRYVIAGSGFDNVKVDAFDTEYRNYLDDLYQEWKGNLSVLEMFRFVYDKNGISCEEMFSSCYAGSRTLNCCQIFEPTYVMTRGRCFRLISPFYQEDVDETDKLTLFFKNPISPLLGGLGTRTQIVFYLGDDHPEIGVIPRYYLNSNDWNRLRLIQKRVSMIPGHSRCSTEPRDQGKSTCFVSSWINSISRVTNCTLPYFYDMLSYTRNLPVCEPSVVIEHYSFIMSANFDNYKCPPACKQINTIHQLITSIDYTPKQTYSFRIEASFNNLEVENYDEVQTTSLVGFIAELGGQSGLFIGCSTITVVQGCQALVVWCFQHLWLLISTSSISVFIPNFKRIFRIKNN